MRPSHYKAHVPTPEERAFIYQQIQEISEFAPGLDGMVMVLEEREKTRKKPMRYAVTLTLGPKDLGLQLRVEAEDIFTALSVAKYEAKESLATIIAGGAAPKGLKPGEVVPAKDKLH
jgi:hypothetical protein